MIARKFRWTDYITINIYWLALTMIANTLTPLVFPLLVQRFVGEEAQGTFVGNIRLWTLMIAVLIQSLMGMVSDHSRHRWGRRRPFILTGTLASLAFITIIAFSTELEGTTGYWFLFSIAILLSVSTNTAQGAQQGLIPDLVPENLRGRFSAVKAILELPIPIIIVSFTVAKLIAAGKMSAGILVTAGVVALAMLITMLVRETPLKETTTKWDWKPFLRLILMTGIFTAIILGMREIVKFIRPMMDQFATLTIPLVVMALVGLLTMSTTIALGVWVSIRAGIGKAARQNPSFTWWVVNRLAYLVPANNLSTFAIFFLQGRLGFADEQAAGPASRLIMIVGLLILLFALPSGWLADRFGHKRLVAISGVVSAIGTLIAMLSTDLTMIYIGGGFIGAATGLFFTANWALGTSLIPKDEAGRYLGISNLAGAGAGAIGAYIGGPIADYFTVRVPEVPGLGYVVLFAIYGILFLLSTVILTRVQEKVSTSNHA